MSSALAVPHLQPQPRMRPAVAALALAVLAAALAAPASAANVCLGYGKEDCLAHSGECVLCRLFDRLDLCLMPDIAAKMPQSE